MDDIILSFIGSSHGEASPIIVQMELNEGRGHESQKEDPYYSVIAVLTWM